MFNVCLYRKTIYSINRKGNTMTESGLRKKLRRQGFGLHKSRKANSKYFDCNDYGGYMIYNLYFNTVEAGEKFNLSFEDVESWANENEDDEPVEKTD